MDHHDLNRYGATRDPKAKPLKDKPRPRSWTVKAEGQIYLNTVDYNLAIEIARTWFESYKSVSVIDNAARRTVAQFIYGRLQ